MSGGTTVRDLLFWATTELQDAKALHDVRAVAFWEIVVRKIRNCVETYHGKGAQHGPRKPDDARRV